VRTTEKLKRLVGFNDRHSVVYANTLMAYMCKPN